MNKKILPIELPRVLSFCLVLLAVVLAWTRQGYAAAPLSGPPSEHVQPLTFVRTVGLLPPLVILFEGQGSGKAVPRDEWSLPAAETVHNAFTAEMAARLVPLAAIGREELGPVDLTGFHDMPDRIKHGGARQLSEDLLSAPYLPASVRKTMELHQVDAAWVVTGICILPPSGSPEPVPEGNRLLLRAALVDRNGTVLFSDMVDESAVAAGDLPFGRPGGRSHAAYDLRDPQTARRFVKAVLAEYRTEQEKTEAALAAGRAAKEKSAEPQEQRPAEFRIGLGVFFLADDGVDLHATFRPAGSHWQFGYRYVRWTDVFDDPFTGNELTETTEAMAGPLVNYLFQPEKDGSFYLGISLLRWSRTELSRVTGVNDSDAVTALYFGGGYTGRLGKYFHYNAGFFLGPGADLKTDTGVSSDESSGGFDIQLQMGVVF